MCAVGGLTFGLAVASSPPWWADVLPRVESVGLGRTSVIPIRPDVARFLSGTRHGALNNVLVSDAGTPLLDERLVSYPSESKAKRRAVDIVRGSGEVGARARRGFFSVRVGCPRNCRHAELAQFDSTVVLLANRYADDASDAADADAAMAELMARYVESSGTDRAATSVDWTAGHTLLVALGLYILYLPFVLWRAWWARRERRTGHPHDRPEAPEIADVCDTAGRLRRRGSLFFGLRLSIFVTAGALMSWSPLVSLAAVPLCWLVALPLRRRRPVGSISATGRQPSSRKSGALLLLESTVLGAAAIVLTALAWILGIVAIGALAPAIVHLVLSDPTPELAQAGTSPLPLALDVAAAVFLLFGALVGGPAVNRFGRRLNRSRTARMQELGRKPIVLYLRDFTDDRRLVAVGDGLGQSANEFFSFRARIPYEEVIARELGGYGAVLSIAEPGSPRLFLPLGASRVHLRDDQWREAVLARMHQAALIVIAVGSTPGLLWEIATATHQGLLDRVLLLIPPDREDVLRSRWQATAEAVKAAGGPSLDPPGDPAEFLIAQLSAHGLRHVAVADRRDEYAYVAALDQALRDVIERVAAKSAQRPVAPPGWYTDPWATGQLRWWDGTSWAARIAPRGDLG